MRKYIQVCVTTSDIKRSRPSWLFNPVSKAMERVFKMSRSKGAVSACDDFILVDLTGNGKCASWSTPKLVGKFIDDFNKGKKVKPFSFKLPVRKFGKLYLLK